MNKRLLISQLKDLLKKAAPKASAILFGSYARDEAKPDSDVDLLILVNQDKLLPSEENRITDFFYDFEFLHGIIMSPIVMTFKEWESLKHQTSLYHQIAKDGVVLQ